MNVAISDHRAGALFIPDMGSARPIVILAPCRGRRSCIFQSAYVSLDGGIGEE